MAPVVGERRGMGTAARFMRGFYGQQEQIDAQQNRTRKVQQR